MAKPPTSQGDDRRAIYEQDMESVRYRHGAKWGRFQTASAIEGAALYVSFKGGLTRTESVLTMVLATLLLAIIFGLVISDERTISAYGKRVREFENSASAAHVSGTFRPLSRFKASYLLIYGILAFNVAVIARLAFWPTGL
jgi:hypothetical protein